MKKLLTLGLALTIVELYNFPTLSQSNNSYTRCQTNPNTYCLRKGDRGQLTRELINNLTCLGYYSGVNDGVFSLDIEKAIINFQKANGLTVDGIAGTETRYSLKQQCVSNSLENLNNGTYLYCDFHESNPEMFGMCFTFRKTGKSIVGIYYPDRSDFEDICVEGRINGNIVNGFARETIELKEQANAIPESESTTLVNWNQQRGRNHLKVARKRVSFDSGNQGANIAGYLHFETAVLDLNLFSSWNSTPDDFPDGYIPNNCQKN
jgi:hypothetical protein